MSWLPSPAPWPFTAPGIISLDSHPQSGFFQQARNQCAAWPASRRFPWKLKGAVMRGRRLSSISLEVLFFLNGWYSATYFLTELFTFLYKGLLLPYPKTNLVLDLVMFFLYLGTEIVRIHFGRKGNLCERMTPLGISLALTFPSALMAFYYFLFQTYVLRIEAVMTMLLLPFYIIQVILEVLTLATLSNKDSL